MNRETLDTRYRFRPDQALHVIGVRTFALAQPATIRVLPEYAGCKSWVSVEDEIEVEGSRAVLDDDVLREKLDRIDRTITSK